jgi:hypothetical protein
MAARGAAPAGRGTSPSRRRDAGSHSVDRIVRMVLFLSDSRSAGKFFGKEGPIYACWKNGMQDLFWESAWPLPAGSN